MNDLCINRLVSGGVITNYHCVSRCAHCLYNCSPQRDKRFLNREMAEQVFACILDLGCRSVHIGGGEPLLNPGKLIDTLSVAREVGVTIDYVETNSAWYIDPGVAVKIIEDLHAVGVGTLLVSISPFHNAFIPYARVAGVIDACRRVGMQVFPWVNGFVRDLTRLDVQHPHTMDEFEQAFGADYLERIPDRYWIQLGGRALETYGAVYPMQSVDEVLEKSLLSCAQALSDTGHFHIDLDGNYIPGLCAGLAIAMDDLGRSLPAGKYPLLDVLWATGIRGLLALARNTYGYRSRREGYLNHCDLCTDIRHFLWQQQKDSDRFNELAPDGFYAELPAISV